MRWLTLCLMLVFLATCSRNEAEISPQGLQFARYLKEVHQREAGHFEGEWFLILRMDACTDCVMNFMREAFQVIGESQQICVILAGKAPGNVALPQNLPACILADRKNLALQYDTGLLQYAVLHRFQNGKPMHHMSLQSHSPAMFLDSLRSAATKVAPGAP